MEVKDFNAMVARNIRFLREERAWSIEELAAKTETIGKSLLIKIESNATENAHKKRINQEYIDDIAKSLGVSSNVITEDDQELIFLFDKASHFPVLINEKSTSDKDDYQKAANNLIIKCTKRGPREQAKALMFVGDFDYNLGMVDLAIRELEHALTLAEIAHDEKLQEEILRYTANCYFVIGQYEKVESILSSKIIQSDLNTHEKKARVLLLRGMAHSRLHYWHLAENFYHQAVSEAQEIASSKVMMGRCLQALGDMYKHMKQYQKAIQTLEEAATVSTSENDKLNVIYSLKTIAEIFVENDDSGNAVIYYRRALEIANNIESFRKIDKYRLMYCLAKYMRNLDEMISIVNQFEEIGIANKEISSAYTEIARVAFEKSKTEIAQYFYEKAIQMIQ